MKKIEGRSGRKFEKELKESGNILKIRSKASCKLL